MRKILKYPRLKSRMKKFESHPAPPLAWLLSPPGNGVQFEKLSWGIQEIILRTPGCVATPDRLLKKMDSSSRESKKICYP
jgi:hypothetical protein